MPRLIRHDRFGLLLTLMILLPHGLGRAADATSLDQSIQTLSEQIAQFLKNKPNSVLVGTYRGDALENFSGGAGISRLLKTKLEDRGFKVGLNGEFLVQGDYVAQQDPFAIYITSTLRRRGERRDLIQFESLVGDVKDAAILSGANVEFRSEQQDEVPTKTNQAEVAKEQLAQLQKSLNSAEAKITDSQITVGKSPYAIELLVRGSDGEFRPRTPELNSGSPFVAIHPDEIYQVRVYNFSNYDCGVSLHIDGLSCFAFSKEEGFKKHDKWVVEAGKTSLIEGWHLSEEGGNRKISEFKVTTYADSPAVKMGAADQVGTITATFHAAWKEGDPAPDGTLDKIVLMGTKMGATRIVPGRLLQRNFGRVRAAISVRYERNDPPDLPSAEKR